MKNKLYAAYGSNLNIRQMALRCPAAVPVGAAALKGWRLTFRGVATLEPEDGAETPVGLWAVTPEDELALDRYEGYPRLYRKESIAVELKGKSVTAMVYLMNGGKPAMPCRGYFDAIARGTGT